MEDTRDDAALVVLNEQGFEMSEPVIYEDGRVRIAIRSKSDSAMVEAGQELWDLVAGRLTITEINARRQAAGETVLTRDPRTDPRPGDELRFNGQVRRVIRREGDLLYCQDGAIRYKIRLLGWQGWCARSGA
jgi:hypothetical protein